MELEKYIPWSMHPESALLYLDKFCDYVTDLNCDGATLKILGKYNARKILCSCTCNERVHF